MLPSIEPIIVNVDGEFLLVVIKTFEIRCCLRGFYIFRDSWKPKPGEMWMPVMKTKRLHLYMIGMELRVKTKMEKLLDVFLNLCWSKCIASLNTMEEQKWGKWQTAILENTCSKGIRNTLNVLCIAWDLKNVFKMSYQRNETR